MPLIPPLAPVTTQSAPARHAKNRSSSPRPGDTAAGVAGPHLLLSLALAGGILGCADNLSRRTDTGTRPGEDAPTNRDTPAMDGSVVGDGGVVTGEVVPEICTNGIDEDRNGSIDDGCPCAVGTRRACWPGPPDLRSVGVCRDGEQTCDSDGATAAWSLCMGSVIGFTEVRDDDTDNDCDGMTDEPGGVCLVSEQQESSCDDGLDTDCDTAIDCDDPDCAGASACMSRCTGEELVCWGEVDDDCDMLADCMDPDCASDPSCETTMPDCPTGQVRTYRARALTPTAGGSSIAPGDGGPRMQNRCEMGSCPSGQVRVITASGMSSCVPPPPDCPAGTDPNYSGYAMWECAAPCDLIIHYGGIYGGLNVCADRPDIPCGSGTVPTFVFETQTWQCRPTCDNGLYDRIYLDGALVCVPC